MSRRIVILLCGLLAVLLLVAACGDDDDGAGTATSSVPPATSAPATTTAPPATSEPAASPATSEPAGSSEPAAGGGDARCVAGNLEARLEPGEPGAGNRYAVLVLVNRGDTTCHTRGYPGLGLAAADGTTLPSDVEWGGAGAPGDPGPSTIELAPGDAASALLHWGAVPGEGDATEGPCQPEAATLLVTPPDEKAQLEIPFGQSVCQGGHIDVTALVPGADGPPIP